MSTGRATHSPFRPGKHRGFSEKRIRRTSARGDTIGFTPLLAGIPTPVRLRGMGDAISFIGEVLLLIAVVAVIAGIGWRVFRKLRD